MANANRAVLFEKKSWHLSPQGSKCVSTLATVMFVARVWRGECAAVANSAVSDDLIRPHRRTAGPLEPVLLSRLACRESQRAKGSASVFGSGLNTSQRNRKGSSSFCSSSNSASSAGRAPVEEEWTFRWKVKGPSRSLNWKSTRWVPPPPAPFQGGLGGAAVQKLDQSFGNP